MTPNNHFYNQEIKLPKIQRSDYVCVCVWAHTHTKQCVYMKQSVYIYEISLTFTLLIYNTEAPILNLNTSMSLCKYRVLSWTGRVYFQSGIWGPALSSDPAVSLDSEPRDAEASCHRSNGMSRSPSHPALPKDAQHQIHEGFQKSNVKREECCAPRSKSGPRGPWWVDVRKSLTNSWYPRYPPPPLLQTKGVPRGSTTVRLGLWNTPTVDQAHVNTCWKKEVYVCI